MCIRDRVGPDGTIYQTLLYDSHLYAIEPSDGTIRWSVDLLDTPVIDKTAMEFDPYADGWSCLLYTSPSPRDRTRSRMPSSA